MEEMLEIRWHGRGGQGAKTASMLLAKAAMDAGFHIQASPEYGPERSGAPITAYNRISRSPIRMHSGITNPDVAVVLDAGLLNGVDVTAGLDENSFLLVNSGEEPDSLRKKIHWNAGRLAAVDADAIAQEETGDNMPNMPMLGALTGIIKIVSLEKLADSVRTKLSDKLGEKKADANISSMRRAFQEVRMQ